MNEATIVFSRQGLFGKTILAREVNSHEHARNMWPLVTPGTPCQLVTWVKGTFTESGALVRRSHFRRFPGARELSISQVFEEEEGARRKASAESREHSQAKRVIAEALTQRLNAGKAMPWFFSASDKSDYSFSGNLLLGAETVSVEKRVTTSFGCTYQLDIAVLSRTISKGPIVLGGVEIEWAHRFDGRKALIGMAQGFPLISVDISGMSLSEITAEWADAALTSTTRSSESGRRKTYVYLHSILHPLYLQLPGGLVGDSRHQFLVFAPANDLKRLEKVAKQLHSLLLLPESAMSVSIVNAKSAQSRKMLENAGRIVGHGWQQSNDSQFLRLTVERPTIVDAASITFHLCMINLLLAHSDSLVGYKYVPGVQGLDENEDIWLHSTWNDETKQAEQHRILPKRLAEPRSTIVSVLGSISQTEAA